MFELFGFLWPLAMAVFVNANALKQSDELAAADADKFDENVGVDDAVNDLLFLFPLPKPLWPL